MRKSKTSIFILIAVTTLLQAMFGYFSSKRSNHQELPVQSSSVSSNDSEYNLKTEYGKLPLSFTANYGQADDQVKFLSRGRGYTLFLTSYEAVLILTQPNPMVIENDIDIMAQRPKTETDVLRMKLAGANPMPVVQGIGRTARKIQLLHW